MLKVPACQLKANGMPRTLEGFHSGRCPWCTWVQASLVHGMNSAIWSKVWRSWTTTAGFCDRPKRDTQSKEPRYGPWDERRSQDGARRGQDPEEAEQIGGCQA